MAETQSSSALAAVSFEGNDLASLLQKEFKPKIGRSQERRRGGGADPGAAGAWRRPS